MTDPFFTFLPTLPFAKKEAPEKDDPRAAPSPATEALDEAERDEERLILCRQCGHGVTRPSERMELQGAHYHAFANPAGILFEIGCFRSADGCAHAGEATEQWSWFQGYAWRVAVCARCLRHLGWLYTATDRPPFYGLILNRLAETP